MEQISIINEQIDNGTANFDIYRAEDQQHSYDNYHVDNKPLFLYNQQFHHEVEDITLIVIDGEACRLENDQPPNLRPLPNDAGILNI
jgi:hypothetical protein